MLACIVAQPASGGQPPAKLDRALRALQSDPAAARVQVIVRSRSAACTAIRNGFENGRRRAYGAHTEIGAVSLDMDVSDLESLASDPCVESVSLDAPVDAHQTESTVSPPVTLDVVRAVVGTELPYKGDKIGVAVIDSGLANVPDLHDQLGPFYDFTQGGKKVAPYDNYGHGTHVAATIGSSGKQNAFLFRGIAPKVVLIGMKVLDGDGKGRTSDVINAVTFATAKKRSRDRHHQPVVGTPDLRVRGDRSARARG